MITNVKCLCCATIQYRLSTKDQRFYWGTEEKWRYNNRVYTWRHIYTVHRFVNSVWAWQHATHSLSCINESFLSSVPICWFLMVLIGTNAYLNGFSEFFFHTDLMIVLPSFQSTLSNNDLLLLIYIKKIIISILSMQVFKNSTHYIRFSCDCSFPIRFVYRHGLLLLLLLLALQAKTVNWMKVQRRTPEQTVKLSGTTNKPEQMTYKIKAQQLRWNLPQREAVFLSLRLGLSTPRYLKRFG